MSCSWSDEVRRTLTPRFAVAIAASVLLHALLAGSVRVPDPGGHAESRAGDPLRAVLLTEEPPAAKAPDKPASLPAETRYYRTRELDVVPGIMTRVQPEFPRYVQADGKVVIRLFIDEAGTVEHVAVLSADPPGTFDASAQSAFLTARFTPGMKAGKPVRTQLVLQVDYQQPK